MSESSQDCSVMKAKGLDLKEEDKVEILSEALWGSTMKVI